MTLYIETNECSFKKQIIYFSFSSSTSTPLTSNLLTDPVAKSTIAPAKKKGPVNKFNNEIALKLF